MSAPNISGYHEPPAQGPDAQDDGGSEILAAHLPLVLEEDPAPSEPYTELGHARRLVAAYGNDLRYIPVWKKWMVWDGARWLVDTTGETQRRGKAVARGALEWAQKVDDDDGGKAIVAAAKRLESSRGVSGILTLAGTEKLIALDPSSLDADPYLLNCANGVLDLRTGELLEPDPMLHLTKVTKAAFRPDAEAPEFLKTLERILPDESVRTFVQRLLGYSLLGVVQEHVLAVFYGVGANGKGTLLGSVDYVLGDYAVTPDPELLAERSGNFHPTSSASLFGARLAVIQEFDEGRRLAEGTVKRLTGGDPIAARRMREDFWEFDPSHTFVMASNYRPVVRGSDEGIWRRLRLVPFDVVIPKEERDGELPQRLRLEADGILTWMVEGYAFWQAKGLDEPDAVKQATQKYRDDSDAVARFIAEKCVVTGRPQCNSTQLFNAFSDWCSAEGLDPGSQTAFSNTLVQRGYDKGPIGGRMTFKGIGLMADPDKHSDQRE
ncbi:DNA primase family protein [Nonomuraea guangzhouensis]|uniref:Phage/plasmid primase, P4 family n=1 Tax=Nonomuraea guangzhouensis TaxID=1291555 RepID=A0ABW4GXX3_9ACTN|nr:phage/plasmid primase, P4 family [Nonomuraea guangzhouensis]